MWSHLLREVEVDPADDSEKERDGDENDECNLDALQF